MGRSHIKCTSQIIGPMNFTAAKPRKLKDEGKRGTLKFSANTSFHVCIRIREAGGAFWKAMSVHTYIIFVGIRSALVAISLFYSVLKNRMEDKGSRAIHSWADAQNKFSTVSHACYVYIYMYTWNKRENDFCGGEKVCSCIHIYIYI